MDIGNEITPKRLSTLLLSSNQRKSDGKDCVRSESLIVMIRICPRTHFD